MEKRNRKKMKLGREARQILFKMPPDLFFTLHQHARQKGKSVNMIVNELTRKGIESQNPTYATS